MRTTTETLICDTCDGTEDTYRDIFLRVISCEACDDAHEVWLEAGRCGGEL